MQALFQPQSLFLTIRLISQITNMKAYDQFKIQSADFRGQIMLEDDAIFIALISEDKGVRLSKMVSKQTQPEQTKFFYPNIQQLYLGLKKLKQHDFALTIKNQLIVFMGLITFRIQLQQIWFAEPSEDLKQEIVKLEQQIMNMRHKLAHSQAQVQIFQDLYKQLLRKQNQRNDSRFQELLAIEKEAKLRVDQIKQVKRENMSLKQESKNYVDLILKLKTDLDKAQGRLAKKEFKKDLQTDRLSYESLHEQYLQLKKRIVQVQRSCIECENKMKRKEDKKRKGKELSVQR